MPGAQEGVCHHGQSGTPHWAASQTLWSLPAALEGAWQTCYTDRVETQDPGFSAVILEVRWGPWGSCTIRLGQRMQPVCHAPPLPPLRVQGVEGNINYHEYCRERAHDVWVPSPMHTETEVLTFVVKSPLQWTEAYLPLGCDLLPLLEHGLYRGLRLDCAAQRTCCEG
ncbi:hypothetical protein NDU88_003588 [Pleurodeles waltl]|uniref:Uncharacterized protein n=1 Tax=Pleurodeles waltl TaxID=8319 RepID=A0AAV7WSR7_PLEWA|nr:hypothetical protein NDU88_003588 [Pleurodeles waltl]